MAKELDRAFQIKRLFEKQMDKSDSRKDFRGRIHEASARMDDLVGPRWRVEIDMPDIEITTVVQAPECGPRAPEPLEPLDTFYERMRGAMLEDGLDPGQLLESMGDSSPEISERRRHKTMKQQMAKLHKKPK